MIMADNDRIDRRQIRHPDARRGNPAWPDPLEGRSIVRPDRIGEDVHALGLDQHRCMADPGGDHPVAHHPFFRHDRIDRHMIGPVRAVIAGQEADKETAAARIADAGWIADPLALILVRIDEAFAVEMVGLGPLIIDAVEKGRKRDRQQDDRHQREKEPGPQPTQDSYDHAYAPSA